jgi:hypothetical protein
MRRPGAADSLSQLWSGLSDLKVAVRVSAFSPPPPPAPPRHKLRYKPEYNEDFNFSKIAAQQRRKSPYKRGLTSFTSDTSFPSQQWLVYAMALSFLTQYSRYRCIIRRVHNSHEKRLLAVMPARLSACTNSAHTGWIFVKFDPEDFYLILSIISKFR